MTAAAQSELPSQNARKRVLSAGHNSAILRLRNNIIQTAGFQVITTKESELLLEIAAKQSFDAVVLCNSIPAKIREHVARELKALKPKVPLIVICSHEEQQQFRSLADEVVVAEHGVSQPLIEAILRVAGDASE